MLNKTTKKRVAKTLKFLKSIDLNVLDLGKHIINDWLYINVQEYMTKDVSECRFESHKNYIDIQTLASGTEIIEITDSNKLEIDEEYNEEKDIMFWKSNKTAKNKKLIKEGIFAVLLPCDIHNPCVAVDGKPSKVRKLVAKIRIAK